MRRVTHAWLAVLWQHFATASHGRSKKNPRRVIDRNLDLRLGEDVGLSGQPAVEDYATAC